MPSNTTQYSRAKCPTFHSDQFQQKGTVKPEHLQFALLARSLSDLNFHPLTRKMLPI